MIMNNLKKKTRLFLLLLCVVLIMILTTYPMQSVLEIGQIPNNNNDKFIHGAIFAMFSFLVLFYFNNYRKLRYYFISIILGFSYSLLTEYIQTFLPSRESSEHDLMAGFAGIILINIYVYVRTRFEKT